LQRVLRWAVGLPIAILVIAFAVANRQSVTLSLDPINPSDPFASMTLPLWLLFFAGITVGVIAGWIGCWFAQGKHRKRARDAQAEVVRLQAERERLMKNTEPEPATAIVPMGTGWI
jgi:uncharacterized integral membrane protein